MSKQANNILVKQFKVSGMQFTPLRTGASILTATSSAAKPIVSIVLVICHRTS